jgi:hypothetical protein
METDLNEGVKCLLHITYFFCNAVAQSPETASYIVLETKQKGKYSG